MTRQNDTGNDGIPQFARAALPINEEPWGENTDFGMIYGPISLRRWLTDA